MTGSTNVDITLFPIVTDGNRMGSIFFGGTYNWKTRTVIQSPGNYILFNVTPYTYNDLDPVAFHMHVSGTDIATDSIQWLDGEHPTSGKFEISVVQGENGTEVDHLNIEMSESGVVISHTLAVENVSLTWDDFYNLEDSAIAPEYQKTANFCFSIWQFMLQHVQFAFDGLQNINQNDAALESTGNIAITGEEFGGTIGSITIGWTDVSGNGELGAADDFNITYAHWWINDPADDIDEIYNGSFKLSGYLESEDSEESAIGGDFVFTNFTSQETEVGIILDDLTILANGGFNLTVMWKP